MDFQRFEIVPGMKSPKTPETELQRVADRLRRTREAFNMKQAQFARLVGIEPQAWSNYEQGLRRISIDQALKVCAATGVTTDWIYRGLMNTSLPTDIQLNLQRKPARLPDRQ